MNPLLPCLPAALRPPTLPGATSRAFSVLSSGRPRASRASERPRRPNSGSLHRRGASPGRKGQARAGSARFVGCLSLMRCALLRFGGINSTCVNQQGYVAVMRSREPPLVLLDRVD